MKNAIIIGGTSGIRKRLAEILLKNNWTVGITGRRAELLDEIRINTNNRILTLGHDVTEIEISDQKLDSLFDLLKNVDH